MEVPRRSGCTWLWAILGSYPKFPKANWIWIVKGMLSQSILVSWRFLRICERRSSSCSPYLCVAHTGDEEFRDPPKLVLGHQRQLFQMHFAIASHIKNWIWGHTQALDPNQANLNTQVSSMILILVRPFDCRHVDVWHLVIQPWHFRCVPEPEQLVRFSQKWFLGTFPSWQVPMGLASQFLYSLSYCIGGIISSW